MIKDLQRESSSLFDACEFADMPCDWRVYNAHQMPRDSFVHLHLHTEYSLLDGAVRMKELMKKAAEFEMPAVAMTDHGNLFGAIEFYQEATSARASSRSLVARLTWRRVRTRRSAEFNARSGLSFHAAGRERDRLSQSGEVDLDRASRRLSLQAADRQGAARETFGRIDRTERVSGQRSQIRRSRRTMFDKATPSAAEYRDILGAENFFLELHDHGIEEQQMVQRGAAEDRERIRRRPGRGERRPFSAPRAITTRTT